MENRYINDEYTNIATELISTREDVAYIKESGISFCVLSSDAVKKSKSKLIYGECECIPAKYKWVIPFDFTITLFDKNVGPLSDEQIRILILHELKHIGVDLEGDMPKYFVIPHDVEDFRSIIDEFGIDWGEVDG